MLCSVGRKFKPFHHMKLFATCLPLLGLSFDIKRHWYVLLVNAHGYCKQDVKHKPLQNKHDEKA